MILKNIFEKHVDRPIEGVIKADDEASLRLEIEEYVLTNEVAKRLESFLDAYTNYKNANGVWVSGFFGSGKSHLLKILALLLENRQIDGEATLDLFLPKCGDSVMLREDLKKAVGIPSKSILFNIDQKADIISKDQSDALLSVFVKVFDEMCGYYGKQGYIAQFERELDGRGLYKAFKSAYESTAGKPWSKGREESLLEGGNIAKAYAQVSGDDEAQALGILNKYRAQHRVSIEDFAEQINAYIKKQPSNFRLNFFVDEVGQYIVGNVRLMTNLQTIAESLASKCRGRAWVIVTAQEDMETVMGDAGKQQSNDFSKIQARFANRMKLTSADVAEVIQKRLLTKNEDGIQVLSQVYQSQSNNFKTLFHFSNESRDYKNFQDEDHFIHSYPFIPYQFLLFQSAIQNLSQHSAFEGKHSSVGERSMLGVFQQVAIQISDYSIGRLATFDLMFEGIRTALKSQTQQAIIQAERELENVFATRLLKALFLVKYVKEFKPTVRNLGVLMLDSLDQDIPALKKQIEEALRLLEQQTYIQRNGELYEYLTNEEKDVEKKIKNIEIEASDIANELEKIVFDHIIRDGKIRSDKNGQAYPFSKKLDDRLYGRPYELTIHILSPFYENAGKEQRLPGLERDWSTLVVEMSSDSRLREDILLYKRTEKYIQQNTSNTQSEIISRIIDGKRHLNVERLREIKESVQSLMGKAKLFVGNRPIEISIDEDARKRVLLGFDKLVAHVYPNLRMLQDIPYTEKDIGNYLKQAQLNLPDDGLVSLPEAEQELLTFIQSENRKGLRITMKHLLEKFERKPYGWYYAAVLCVFVQLYARGKVEVYMDGNIPERNALKEALQNTRDHSNMILYPQVEFTASQTRTLKTFYEDFFDAPLHSNEAKVLAKEMNTALQGLIQDLTPLASQTDPFPFLSVLTPVINQLKQVTGKPSSWYLTDFVSQQGNLLDMKENVIDPVRTFMNGEKKNIFVQTRKFMQTHEPNFAYIDGNDDAEIYACLDDPKCFKGKRMQQMKAHVDALKEKIALQTAEEIGEARENIEFLKSRLCGMAEFAALSDGQQKEILHPFENFIGDIKNQELIAVIRDRLRRFEEKDYQKQLDKMTIWVQAAQIVKPGPASKVKIPAEAGASAPPERIEKPIEYIPSRSVQVAFEKAWLADEADVDHYLKSMRRALLEEIKKGKRISI